LKPFPFSPHAIHPADLAPFQLAGAAALAAGMGRILKGFQRSARR
jgi:hypothetical protein